MGTRKCIICDKLFHPLPSIKLEVYCSKECKDKDKPKGDKKRAKSRRPKKG